MESKILAAIMDDRAAYNNIKDTVEDSDFSDLGNIILKEIVDYYAVDKEAANIDKEVLESRLERKYPHHKDSLKLALDNIQPVSIPNVMSEYVELRIAAMSRRLGSLLLAGNTNGEVEELTNELQFLKSKREEALGGGNEDGEIFIGTDLEEVFEDLKPENVIRIYPPSVNEVLGDGAPRGSHIVIFARPEAGKSLFNINLTAELLKQGLHVMYIGNEDPAGTMVGRVIYNLSGMTRRDVLADMSEAQDRANLEGYKNLVFVSKSPGTVSDVRRLVAKFKPDVFIVDQMRNLGTSRTLTKVEGLEYVAQSMRNIGKEHNALAISVTQAGDSAEGKLHLTMGDVDFSNTGIPATADVMIGIGVNEEFREANRRVLSLCKNKISGIHAQIPVKVEPQLSRVLDIGD